MPSDRLPRRAPWAWGSIEGAVRPRGPDGDRARLAARAVATSASADALFLWLCQLRRAPYSYDLLDNLGRRSPRTPDPSMMRLEAGQSIMTIFSLTAFDPGRSLTVSMRPGLPTLLFGAITVRYAIVESRDGRALLRGDLSMPPLPGPLGRARRQLLAWGDLLMMRKQLRTLVSLAERESGSAVASGSGS